MKTLVLFLTIFFAVFLANVASHFATATLVVAGIGQVFEDVKAYKSQPTQQNSPALERDIQRLNSNLKPQIEQVQAHTKEQQRAFENDARLCKSWRQMYLKDRDQTSKMHMESACKRAYGN